MTAFNSGLFGGALPRRPIYKTRAADYWAAFDVHNLEYEFSTRLHTLPLHLIRETIAHEMIHDAQVTLHGYDPDLMTDWHDSIFYSYRAPLLNRFNIWLHDSTELERNLK